MLNKLIAAALGATLSFATGPLLATSADAASTMKPKATMAQKVFIGEAMMGSNSEVALGQLASEKGGSDKVKSFGQMLVTDHNQAKTDLMPIAQDMGVAATDKMEPAASAEMKKLQGLSGAAFDKEFAAFMVKDHKEAIAKFQREAKGKGALAEFAGKTLPTLQKHLDEANSLTMASNG